jgi:3-oxoacyl-[acyl-carrier protein] reductase
MAASSPTEPSRRTAVVSGAASGMGLAVAERFITEGWTVIGIDRDAESLLMHAAAHDPAAFRPAVADITDRGAVSRALGDISGLAAVVNAAGIYPPTTCPPASSSTAPPRPPSSR